MVDSDLLALGLGGTSMMAMLWTVASGRRAVGVEMRGDPFLGVHRNTYCAEVLSPGPDRTFLERFSELGEYVGKTRHDEMDDAMREAYSEYSPISDWRFCPDDADPLEYIRGRSES